MGEYRGTALCAVRAGGAARLPAYGAALRAADSFLTTEDEKARGKKRSAVSDQQSATDES